MLRDEHGAAYSDASAANAPNATISRLSHECRSPSTARNAYCGRPRWNRLAASANSPNPSAVDGVQRTQRAQHVPLSQSFADQPDDERAHRKLRQHQHHHQRPVGVLRIDAEVVGRQQVARERLAAFCRSSSAA